MTRCRRLRACCFVLSLVVVMSSGCGKSNTPEVVVYTAHDRGFSEPILQAFEAKTGIRVRAKYDTEATKTVGLVNALRAEKGRPRCDVFWNNEIVNTLRLKNEGILASVSPASADAFPATFRDPDGYWFGFAARARILLVNTNLIEGPDFPRKVADLGDPRFKGQVGLAKPLFGTTATHVACLYAAMGAEGLTAFFDTLKANDIQVMSGNRGVAQAVAEGRIAFGLTDTDDALAELQRGSPVRIVYPDTGPDDVGVLFIPNTLAVMQGAPNPEAALSLVNYLLSPEVETALARSAAGQIPLNPAVTTALRVKSPREARAMDVDFAAAAAVFASAAELVQERFLE